MYRQTCVCYFLLLRQAFLLSTFLFAVSCSQSTTWNERTVGKNIFSYCVHLYFGRRVRLGGRRWPTVPKLLHVDYNNRVCIIVLITLYHAVSLIFSAEQKTATLNAIKYMAIFLYYKLFSTQWSVLISQHLFSCFSILFLICPEITYQALMLIYAYTLKLVLNKIDNTQFHIYCFVHCSEWRVIDWQLQTHNIIYTCRLRLRIHIQWPQKMLHTVCSHIHFTLC